MRKILTYILILISISSFSQTWDKVNNKYFYRSPFIQSGDSLEAKILHLDVLTSFPVSPSKDWIVNKKDTLYIYNGFSWDTIGPKKSSGSNVNFNGNRTVTRSGLPNINAGGTTMTDWINNYFFPSTSPTATPKNRCSSVTSPRKR